MMQQIVPVRRTCLKWGLAAAGLALAAPVRATVPAPRGPVVLTLSGRVSKPNQGPVAAFDMAALEALPQRSHTTATPWFPQSRKFTGPLLSDVLAAAGASGETLRTEALNDYRVDLPMDDVRRYGVILARMLDDKPISVREKGPLFVIYPFADHPEIRNTVFYSRCIWQLKSIAVL